MFSLSIKDKLIIIFFMCILVYKTQGAQAIRKPVPKPTEFADREGCYDPDLKIVFSYDVPFFTHNCTRHVCKTNGDIIISSCAAIFVPEGEVLIKGNNALPYPRCCDSIDMSKHRRNPETFNSI